MKTKESNKARRIKEHFQGTEYPSQYRKVKHKNKKYATAVKDQLAAKGAIKY